MANYPSLAFDRSSSKSPTNRSFRIRVIGDNVSVDPVAFGQSFNISIVHEFIQLAEKDVVLAFWAANKGTATTLVWPADYPIDAAFLTGTVQAATATTIQLESGASAVDDAYNGMWVQVGAHQYREIADYVGATRTATVATMSPVPAPGDVYGIHAVITPLTLYITGRPEETSKATGWWSVSLSGVAE